MSPQEALQLERGDIALYQHELWLVGTVRRHGYVIGLVGRYTNSIVPTTKVFLA